jgi:hypothetical protein
MRTGKVVESIDIEAPRDEVFDIVANCDRRLHLSPLWDAAGVTHITPDFPHEGSRYRTTFLDEGDMTEFDTIVTAFIPSQKFAYRLICQRETRVMWTFQDVARGTRLMYREEFLVEEDEAEQFVQAARQVIREWLDNVRLYAELRGGWRDRLARRLMDRHLLRLSTLERRVVLMILVLQGMACITSLALGIGLAVAGLL